MCLYSQAVQTSFNNKCSYTVNIKRTPEKGSHFFYQTQSLY